MGGDRDDQFPEDETPQTWTADDESVNDLPPVAPDDDGRLALDDGDDDRLPWLQSSDDDRVDEGVDGGRVLGVILLGLVALAAIVGGIWWVSNRGNEDTMAADGSTIPAPVQPYKEKPRDPGGKTFQGTGDTSFAVSVGQTRNAKLDQGRAPAAPANAEVPAATPKTSASAGTTSTPAVTGVGVQIGAFSSQAAAEAAWGKLSQSHDALSGVNHRVMEGSADIGTVYRLQAVSGDVAGANALCAKLKASGLACQVKR